MKKRLLAALAAAIFLGSAGPAPADVAADRCGGNKTKAAAKYAKGLFACHAYALRRNTAVDPECLTRASGKLAASFHKAELTPGCVTADDEATAQSIVDAARSAVDALLTPDPDDAARECAGTKLQASGRYLFNILGCYGKAAPRGLGANASCLSAAFERLVLGFAAAEERGGCTTTTDQEAVSAVEDDAAHDVLAALSPVCGDEVQGPTQQCEGAEDAACPGLCSAACVCVFPPECGDGVAELPEECDDTNLDDGDGCSSFCQLENTGALCSGVPATTGTAIDAVLVSNDFTAPLFVTSPPLDAKRLFVVEREGYIRILNLTDNTVNPAPFLDIHDLTTTGGERGFLGMAFDPAYETNGRFFVSYTNTTGDLVLARYEVDGGNPDLADEATRKELLVVPHPGASNHNGGALQFSIDGYLYWSMGDGGMGNDADDENFMLGKLLRIDVAHDSAPFATVPATNPYYVDGTSDLEYIWARGLRNPWRFSFDRANGDLYIGDVGAGSREEIDYAPGTSTGGENYGWNTFEGTRCNKEPCPEPPVGYTMPITDYGHVGGGCAVMGGYVYRGCAMPDLAGSYFYSDLCSMFVNTLEVVGGVATNLSDRTDDAKETGASFGAVVSWGQDARGELYIVAGNDGIYRIEPD